MSRDRSMDLPGGLLDTKSSGPGHREPSLRGSAAGHKRGQEEVGGLARATAMASTTF